MYTQALLTHADAPHARRSIQIGPNTRVNLVQAGHPLAGIKPQTKLGEVALNLAINTSTSLLSVAATTAYVYAVQNLIIPKPQFGSPPSGVDIDPKTLQPAWNKFVTETNVIQGQLGTFVDTTPGSADPTSILSQLVSVPQSIEGIAGSVTLDFASKNKTELEALLNAVNDKVSSLNTSLQTLGTNMTNGTATLNQYATSGVLKQLYDAYETDIGSLQQAISNAQSTIDSDNSKIVGLGFAVGGSIVVGIIGIANFWNPIGWIFMAGGALGAYFSIVEIEKLKAEIASLKNTIETDTDWENDYSQAATAMMGTIGTISGFSTMNAAAQKELTALEQVLSNLTTDITDAVSDLDAGEWTQAQNEWNEILSTAQTLSNITAYVWPGPPELMSPTQFTSAQGSAYVLTSSGQPLYLENGATSWTACADRCLSIVSGGTGSDSKIVGINGAPAVGAAGDDPAYTTNYYVRTYDQSSNAWTDISTFPAAQIAVCGSNIFAINQTTDNRQVWQYSGSGTNWTQLPALPNQDAASQIAVAGSTVFAVTTNSQTAYYYNGSSWTEISLDAGCILIAANDPFVGLVSETNQCWLWNATNNNWQYPGPPVVSTGSNVLGLAQLSDGTQLIVNKDLRLLKIDNSSTPSTSTQLIDSGVVGIIAGGSNVYRVDQDGKSYVWSDPTNNTWTELPALPS